MYSQALSLYPIETVTERLLLPVLQEVGRRWKSRRRQRGGRTLRIFLRTQQARCAIPPPCAHQGTGPRILAACLPDEQHELGLLIFALAAHERGLHIVMLAAQTPLEELTHGGAPRPLRCDRARLDCHPAGRRDQGKTSGDGRSRSAFRCSWVVSASLRERDGIVAAHAEVLGTDIHAAVERIRLTLGDVVAH